MQRRHGPAQFSGCLTTALFFFCDTLVTFQGPLDLTELDDSELAEEAEIQSPSPKKARKEVNATTMNWSL